MKIEKAIELLLTHQADLALTQTPDLNDSIYLGIEALKGITAIRCGAIVNYSAPLPGETE